MGNETRQNFVAVKSEPLQHQKGSGSEKNSIDVSQGCHKKH